jgi:hypothetical protein
MNQICVPLVDDNLTFLPIATRLLQGQSDVVVVDTAGGGEEFLAQGQGLQIVSKIPGSRGNLYPSSYVGQRPEAKAVGLKERIVTQPKRNNHIPKLVSRPRLIEQLNAGLHRRFTLISAPASFGKATLLSE